MKKSRNISKIIALSVFKKTVISTLIMICFFGYSQEVKTAVDSTKVKIGRPINYTISVFSDSISQIEFPTAEYFSNWSVNDSLDIDTVIDGKNYEYKKRYELLGFDSSIKSIPSQVVSINGRTIRLDSILIEIQDVKVDTISKKIFGIKEIEDVQASKPFDWSLIIIILSILVIFILGFIVYRNMGRKERKIREKKLKPFEKATLDLENIEKSKYIRNQNYKDYYSDLTNTLKHYIESELSLSVMETTSNQLILKLKAYIKQDKIAFNSDLISKLEIMLNNSDLVKFAKSTPEVDLLQEDYQLIKLIVDELKNTLPERIIQEQQRLAMLEEEQIELRKKQRKKTVFKFCVASAVVVGFILIAVNGFVKTWDTIVGNHTKKLLEGEWITSDYGYPPLVMETPDILKRVLVELTEQEQSVIKDIDAFELGKISEEIYISVEQVSFIKALDSTQLSKIVQGYIFKRIEALGGKNILPKQESFSTESGAKGIKVYGRFDYKKNDKNIIDNFTTIAFVSKENIIILQVTYPDKDRYARDIEERILMSVDFLTNPQKSP